ncbi:MAG: hypothetical protein ACJ8FU_08220 [Xanthobacteraceae bacterium]
MNDLSKLSDDDLKALYAQTAPAAAPSADLSKLSDDDLKALYQKSAPPSSAASMFPDEFGRPTIGRDTASDAAEGKAGVESALDMFTLGLKGHADAIGKTARGAVDRLLGREADPRTYGEHLQASRARDAQLAEESPNAALAGKVAGGLAAGVGAARSGLTLAPLAENAGLLGRIGTFGLEGAGWGAANAAGHADTLDPAEFAQKLGHGAREGAVFGAGLPVLGSIAGATFKAGSRWLGPKPDGVEGAAGRVLEQALPTNTPERLAELGPEASVADVSPSMQGVAQGTAGRPGPAADKVVGFLKARDERVPTRLGQALDETLGPDVSPQALATDIAATRKAVVDPLNQAGDQGTVEAGNLAERPSVGAALNTAAKAAADEGAPLATVLRDEAGNIVPNDAAETFAAGSRQRLDRALGDTLGYRGRLATRDEIKARRSAEAAPHYERGNATAIDYDSDAGQALEDLYGRMRRSFPEATGTARRLLAAEEKPAFHANEELLSRPPGSPEPSAGTAAPIGQAGSGGPRPDSLSRFIARNGGLRLDGETADLPSSVRGVGKLVHENGRSIDGFWRDKLIEAGYLPRDPDGGQARDITNELANLLRRDLRGDRVYPEGWQEQGRVRMSREERDHFGALRNDILRDLTASEHGARDPRSINEEVLDRAVGFLAGRQARTGTEAYDMAAATHAAEEADPRKFLPTARHWDYIKRGLDDVIRNNTDKLTGDVSQIGRAALIQKQDLLSHLDEVAPDLKTARGIWADETGGMDALEMGRKALAGNISREQVAREIADMGDGQRELYALGLSNAVRENMANAANPQTALSKPAFLEKVRLVAGPEAAARLEQALEAERQAFTESMVPNAQAWRRAYEVLKDRAAKATGPEAEGLKKAADDLRAAMTLNPKFREALAKSDYYDRVKDAADKGRTIFDKDRNAPRPDDLAAQWAEMTPGERAAIYKGARSEVGHMVGHKSNDLQALKQGFGLPGDFANQNAEIVFGQEPVAAIRGRMDAESQMRDTYQRVFGGTQTQPRQAGVEMIDKASAPNFPVEATAFGSVARAAQALTRFAFKGYASLAQEATRNELARIITLPAAERDRVVDAILTASGERGANAARIKTLIARQIAFAGSDRDRRAPEASPARR